MGVNLVAPEVSFGTSLLTELERNNDCLFAVAYLTREGVREISEVLNRRLDARRFSIRIVCCVSDFITDPEALEDLYGLGKRRRGSMKVRWHSQAGFHAKGYGFRKAGKTSVFIGSWNVTGKALGADSGELGISIASSVVVEEAWSALERFWDDGIDLTTAWLRKYRAACTRYRKHAAAANRSRDRWRGKFRGRRRASVSLPVTGASLYFDHVVPIDRDDKAKVERAREKARKEHGLETANGWICFENKAQALTVPRDRPILHVHWRSRDHWVKGARLLLVVRLRGAPVRIVDPETGATMWLLYFNGVRGMRAPISTQHHQRATRILARHGLTWSTLWNMKPGFLRARRKALLAILRNLQRLVKP